MCSEYFVRVHMVNLGVPLKKIKSDVGLLRLISDFEEPTAKRAGTGEVRLYPLLPLPSFHGSMLMEQCALVYRIQKVMPKRTVC